jgi:hypothetical protein
MSVGVNDGVRGTLVSAGIRVTVGWPVEVTIGIWLVVEQPAKQLKRNSKRNLFILLSLLIDWYASTTVNQFINPSWHIFVHKA